MKVNSTTHVIGIICIVLAVVFFLGWFFLLLEPIQLKIVEKEMVLNKTLLYLGATFVSIVMHTLWMMGSKMIGARKFNAEYIEFKGALASKGYWLMLGVVLFIINLFTFFWTLGL